MTKTIKEYFDPYGIKPRVHAPIRDKEKLKEIDEVSDALMKLKAFFGERPKATTTTPNDQTGGTERKQREIKN